MAKEIQKLTSLVLEGCCSPQPSDGTPGAFDLRYRQILHEVHYLRHRLPIRISGLGKRKACNMYTRQFQATLIALMDALYEVAGEAIRKHMQQTKTYDLPADPADGLAVPDRQTLVRLAHQALFGLLTAVRNRLRHAPPHPVNVPRCMQATIQAELHRQLQPVLAVLQEPTALDTGICDAISETLLQLADGKATALTFYSCHYISAVASQLLSFTRRPEAPDATDILLGLLAAVNLNTTCTAQACKTWIATHTDIGDAGYGATRLMQIRKVLLQSQPTKQMAADPNRQALRSELTQWINEELAWLRLREEAPQPRPQPAPRIETGLTVPQIAFFIRLMVEEGLLPKDNQAELLRLFARYFSSRNTGEISTGSLRSKYYQIERTTSDFIRGLLLQLARRTHGYPQ